VPDVAARRLGEDEAYLTVRDILSEASTVADGALSSERSGFYRCGFATLGFTLAQNIVVLQRFAGLGSELRQTGHTFSVDLITRLA